MLDKHTTVPPASRYPEPCSSWQSTASLGWTTASNVDCGFWCANTTFIWASLKLTPSAGRVASELHDDSGMAGGDNKVEIPYRNSSQSPDQCLLLLASKQASAINPSSPVEFKSLDIHDVRSAPSNSPQAGWQRDEAEEHAPKISISHVSIFTITSEDSLSPCGFILHFPHLCTLGWYKNVLAWWCTVWTHHQIQGSKDGNQIPHIGKILNYWRRSWGKHFYQSKYMKVCYSWHFYPFPSAFLH